MKYFTTKEDYYQFVKNWKLLVNSGAFKGKPHMFVIYNILKDRDPLYGFSDNTKCHVLFLMNIEISREIALYTYNDNRSNIIKLLENINITSDDLVKQLRMINIDIINNARSLVT